MFKKITTIILVVVILTGLAFWSPWSSWNFSILKSLGLKSTDNFAGLQIYSTSGEIEVSVDNQVVGNVTEEGSPLDIFEIEPGDHLVVIKRIASDSAGDVIYYEFTKMINFVKGVSTVIAYEIGPSERFSGGYVIYATASVSEEKTSLNIRTEPENAKIYINDLEVNDSPLVNYELDLSQDYAIKISADNYEDIEFKLLPESKEEKDLIKGYDLNVDVNLFELPLELREVNE